MQAMGQYAPGKQLLRVWQKGGEQFLGSILTSDPAKRVGIPFNGKIDTFQVQACANFYFVFQ